MSLINGDKSRAHRVRKQNIQRRMRTQALLQTGAAKTNQTGVRKKAKTAVRHEPVAQYGALRVAHLRRSSTGMLTGRERC